MLQKNFSHSIRISLGTTSRRQTYPCQTQTLILHRTRILTPFCNPMLILRPSATQCWFWGPPQPNADFEALRRDQHNDSILAEPWSSADQENSPYITKHGILHRKSADWLGEPIWQIVLPANRCQQVLDLAHSTPIAGHGGHKRTKYKIL